MSQMVCRENKTNLKEINLGETDSTFFKFFKV